MRMIRPVPKPTFKRSKPTRKQRNNFSREVREKIYERDEGKCQECFRIGTEIHHVKFRSQGGRGVVTNGLLLCADCHRKIHQVRKFAKKWQEVFEERYGQDYYKDEWDE